MLGVVIANSILLLFNVLELSDLPLIIDGFWYQNRPQRRQLKRPSDYAHGDVFFLLGMVWLFAQTGTLLFYNNGAGSIEAGALAGLLAQSAALGLTRQGRLDFLSVPARRARAQFPLHVWLPDAMEGPTAGLGADSRATMVAAGVLSDCKSLSANAGRRAGRRTDSAHSCNMGRRIYCRFAAMIAVAQNDISAS